MKSLPSFAIWLVCVLAGAPVSAADYYEWTDAEGVTHFTDSLQNVPPRYRRQLAGQNQQNAGHQLSTHPATSAPAVSAPSAPASVAPAKLEVASTSRRFEIPFKAYEGSARRVIIPVKLNEKVTAQMALDTGSPGMLISIDLAERLGVFTKDKGTLLVNAGGIGGEAPAIRTVIDSIAVGEAHDTFVPTTIVESMSSAFDGLIGMDFMSNYTLSIDSRKNVVVFQWDPPEAPAPGGHNEEWWRKNFTEFRSARDDWRQYAEDIKRELEESYEAAGGRSDELRDLKAIAGFQSREAERLFQRLEQYASANAVPKHWR